jgi:hypothetical protein
MVRLFKLPSCLGGSSRTTSRSQNEAAVDLRNSTPANGRNSVATPRSNTQPTNTVPGLPASVTSALNGGDIPLGADAMHLPAASNGRSEHSDSGVASGRGNVTNVGSSSDPSGFDGFSGGVQSGENGSSGASRTSSNVSLEEEESRSSNVSGSVRSGSDGSSEGVQSGSAGSSGSVRSGSNGSSEGVQSGSAGPSGSERSGSNGPSEGERSGSGVKERGERSGSTSRSGSERSGSGVNGSGERSGSGAPSEGERSGSGVKERGERSGSMSRSGSERSGSGVNGSGERSGSGVQSDGASSGSPRVTPYESPLQNAQYAPQHVVIKEDRVRPHKGVNANRNEENAPKVGKRKKDAEPTLLRQTEVQSAKSKKVPSRAGQRDAAEQRLVAKRVAHHAPPSHSAAAKLDSRDLGSGLNTKIANRDVDSVLKVGKGKKDSEHTLIWQTEVQSAKSKKAPSRAAKQDAGEQRPVDKRLARYAPPANPAAANLGTNDLWSGLSTKFGLR